ncbi:response regulator [Candidatus Magnetomonas plexicatena]|uniref:response regulator n=1 Tax=Candidatus Magnetomonas plexicatena TaxID=2552947 RepID=UPI001C796805|nr:response regulator [Nitrospirales bacterium LBB_01]
MRKKLVIGQQIDVFVFDEKGMHQKDKYGSEALTHNNPWLQNPFPLLRNTVVTGVVIALDERAAFLRLDDSYIQGFIPLRDFTISHSSKMNDFLEVGDSVRGVITEVGFKKYDVCLSIKDYNATIKEEEKKDRIKEENKTTIGNLAVIKIEREKKLKLPPYRILVVDGQNTVLNSLADYLRSFGTVIDKADTFAKAENYIKTEQYDFIFIDKYLDEKKNGIDLIRILHQEGKYPQKGIFLITGEENSNLDIKELINMKVTDILLKPIHSTTLRDILMGNYKSALTKVHSDEIKERLSNAVFQRVKSEIRLFQFDIKEQIKILFEEIKRLIRCDAIVIFSYEETVKNIVLSFYDGVSLPGDNIHIKNIAYSPVADIFKEGEAVFMQRDETNQFRYFHDFIPNVTSMIGYPVYIQGETKYVIALFRTDGRLFTKEEFEKGEIFPEKLSLILKRAYIKTYWKKNLFSVSPADLQAV